MFEETGRDTDEFVDLQGQDMVNIQNMESYLNVFEMELDDLINENGGLDCSLAIAEEKRMKEEQEEEKELTITDYKLTKDKSIISETISNK